MRHSAPSRPDQAAADLRRFAEDVAYYLSLSPRQLPSRYFYDALGSALFDAICRLPWYRITPTEHDLLQAHARAVIDRASGPTTLVELGPGSGSKVAALIGAADPVRPIEVHLVDVSAAALEASVRALEGHRQVSVVTHEAEYEAGLSQVARLGRSGRRLVLFLGSNIGNFDPPGADAFLRAIRAAEAPGDRLLLGADLVKPEVELLLAYDDPLGVTAAFNRNLLVRVNRELGADFDLDGFTHRARWNADASRVEMHLVSARQQRVRIPASGLDVLFESGESIWTESSYKYRPDEIARMLARAGFATVSQWSRDDYALTLAEAAPDRQTGP
jgi:L-histidine Nalpha-methyltransferase